MWLIKSFFSGLAYLLSLVVGAVAQMASYIAHAMWPSAATQPLQDQDDAADEHITVEQFNALNAQATIALKEAHVRQFIIDGHITVEQFNALNVDATIALKKAHVRQFITDGHINIGQYATLNEHAASALRMTPEVCQFIIDRHITVEQFNDLNVDATIALREAPVRQFITDGHINIGQYATLNEYAASTLRMTSEVCQFIIDRHITVEQFNALNVDATIALREAPVRQLIVAHRMTLAQLSRLDNYELRKAITDPGTIQRILAGELEVEAIIGRPAMAVQRNAFNANQNTHTASVHKSVSESAQKLYERYKNQIQGENLHAAINSLVQDIFMYPNPVMATYNGRQRDCVPSARECIKRIAAADYAFEDATSEVSTRTLLALASLATRDSAVLLGGIMDDAIKQIIQGLYEIEREYNISNPDKDNENTRSSSACQPGTFNKIIEKLVGIHPDCTIIFINRETLALKMRVIVLENIAKYIANAKLLDRFFSSYKDGAIFSDNDWTSIWDAIKDNVKNDISTYYAKENVIEPQVLQWINYNMDGYNNTDDGCPLTPKDMGKIRKLLPGHKPEQQVTPIVYSKMKRSASLDDIRSSAIPRLRSNTM